MPNLYPWVKIQPKLAPTVTGYIYDHGVNGYAAAPLTGSFQFAIPGLLPTFGKDDGALRGDGTATYPAASAISSAFSRGTEPLALPPANVV